MNSIDKVNLPNLLYRGKVRDTFPMSDNRLLIVATDRISVFDVVLPSTIPGKGIVLSKISSFWFDLTKDIIPNHLIDLAIDNDELDIDSEILQRGSVVKKAERIDVECVVRGYITGSAWSEYKKIGKVAGFNMPNDLKEGDKFPVPLFTPTTKAEVGHDEPLTMDEVKNMVGNDMAGKLESISIEIYNFAHEFALSKGILIADTKMEFGMIDGNLTLIDELLTPDSSRFWDLNGYSPGKSQPNYDKQFVRDWVDSAGWDHEPPAPELPTEIIKKTQDRYLQAYNKLTGLNI
ncbi:MAG: phosphoribosylaminoimidazolesuccinocarboxamide synthase [Chloroflexi bacterium]|nr:phosphoribosylaminoimidazolesuccinocarboxamide synthase [Chloroflexota bacterium]